MSTATPQQAAPAHALNGRREILIVSHSNLFYWWPVWAIAFLFALITAFTGERVVLVPDKSELLKKATGSVTYEVSDDKEVSKEKKDTKITKATVEFDTRDL